MFGVSIEINAEMLQEQEHPKTIHRHAVQVQRRGEKTLKVMFDDALERNTETLKEKEQQEKMLKEKKLTLQAFERKNTELQVFYNEDKEKKTRKASSEMQSGIQEVVRKNAQP